MAKQAITIESFLKEMVSFTTVTPEKMELAKTSKITTSNSKPLTDLMKAWVRGDYDESPEQLVSEIEYLLPETPKP